MSNAFEISQDGGSASSDAVLVGRSHNNPTFSNLGYTGTLTGGTGIINIGSGQIYKDASGNVGIGTSNPRSFIDLGDFGPDTQISWHTSSTTAYGYIGLQGQSAAIGILSGLRMGYTTTFQSSVSAAWAKSAIILDYGNISFFSNPVDTVAYGTTYEPTERLRITPDGNVCIGATAPTYSRQKVFTYSASEGIYNTIRSDNLPNNYAVGHDALYQDYSRFIGIYVAKHSGIANSVGEIQISTESGTTNHIWVDNSNILRISTTFSNIGTTSGTVVGAQTSDERLKNITGPVPYGLDEVLALEPIAYAMKSEPDVPKIGFSAQQVLPIIPESVFDTHEELEPGEPTKLGMEYVSLIPVLVNAIKALNEELQTLKARIN